MRYRSGQKRGSDRAVHASANGAKDFFVAHGFFDFSDLGFGKTAHIPRAFAAADIFSEIF